MRFAVLALGALLFFMAVVAWVIWQGVLVPTMNRSQSTQETAAPPTTPVAVVPVDWQRYEGGVAGVHFAYPPEARITESENTVSVLYIGPTQAEGTEIYDGYAVAFERRAFPEGVTTLRQFAERRLADDAPHGEIVEPLSPTTVNGQEGFTYVLEGLGRFTIMVLPAGNNEAVTVSYLVEDPQRGDYQEIVDTLLSTLVVTP